MEGYRFNHKSSKESNKVVNDKFKTLTKLKFTKNDNEYYKQPQQPQKLNDGSKKLSKTDKERLELHRKQLNVMGKIDDVQVTYRTI